MPGVTVRSMMVWNPGESDLMSSALRFLKGARTPGSWQKLAQRVIEYHGADLLRSDLFAENPAYVSLWPVPSKDGKADHARLFAEALSGFLGLALGAWRISPGAPNDPGILEQKRKNRQARLKGGFYGELKPVRAIEEGFHVLIDDILTTGGTSFAAAKAMGWPWEKISMERRPRIEVWVLAHRSRLAP